MSTLGKCFLTLITWFIPDLFMNSLDMHFKMSSFGEWFLTVNTLMIPYLFMNSLDMLTSDFEAMELHIHTDSFMFELNVLLWMRLPWTLVITLITRIPYPFMNRINMFSQMSFWWCFVLTLTTVKLYSFVNCLNVAYKMSTLKEWLLTVITWMINDLFMNSLDMYFKILYMGEWFLTYTALMIPYFFMNCLDMHLQASRKCSLISTLITRISYSFVYGSYVSPEISFAGSLVITLITKILSFLMNRLHVTP